MAIRIYVDFDSNDFYKIWRAFISIACAHVPHYLHLQTCGFASRQSNDIHVYNFIIANKFLKLKKQKKFSNFDDLNFWFVFLFVLFFIFMSLFKMTISSNLHKGKVLSCCESSSHALYIAKRSQPIVALHFLTTSRLSADSASHTYVPCPRPRLAETGKENQVMYTWNCFGCGFACKLIRCLVFLKMRLACEPSIFFILFRYPLLNNFDAILIKE